MKKRKQEIGQKQKILILLYKGELEGLEKAIGEGYAANRNEAIRDAIRVYLKDLGLW